MLKSHFISKDSKLVYQTHRSKTRGLVCVNDQLVIWKNLHFSADIPTFCNVMLTFNIYANPPVCPVNVTTFPRILEIKAAANFPGCFGNNAAVQIPAHLSEDFKKGRRVPQRDVENQRNKVNRDAETAIVKRHFRFGMITWRFLGASGH